MMSSGVTRTSAAIYRDSMCCRPECAAVVCACSHGADKSLEVNFGLIKPVSAAPLPHSWKIHEKMQRVWAVFKAHPYVGNVLGYTALFASADLIQQSVFGDRPLSTAPTEHTGAGEDRETSGIDWHQTARVATVGFCFHANFNYHWLKALERMLPGAGPKMVTAKVVLDQLIAAPLTISAFYTGLSYLERKDDLFEDWRQKFWTSYKAGVVYWSTMQAINFSLVPPVARTVFLGGIALTFTVFLCHMKRQESNNIF